MMDLKEQYKEAFKLLKEEVDVNAIFSEFNRQLVLAISSGDAHPKSGDTLDGVLKEMCQLRRSSVGEEFDLNGDEEKITTFVKHDIQEETSFKHYCIEISLYHTRIDYFVNLGEVDSDKVSAAETYIQYYKDSDMVCATIMIRQKHDSVSDETIGKILKHEVTHVMLFGIEHLSITNLSYLSSIEDTNDRVVFDEFLCDYIQCEHIAAGPNDNPLSVFDDICENYLTWVANDAYVPYKEAVAEYYKDLEETTKEGSETGE